MNHGQENRVILVGTLVNLGRGDKKEASIERRNNLGATITTFTLELSSPFGDAFTIPLEAIAQTAGKELLTRSQIGQALVVEGTIRRRVTNDRRTAVADNDIGARTVETQITVAQIRLPREDEPLGYSAVWLEGKVLTPPRIGNHRALRDVQMARVIVQVTLKRPSPYPGSKAMITEQMEVMVALPTEAEAGADALYQPGNVVRIEGQLDMTRIPQTNMLVQGKLDALEQTWKAQRAVLEAATPQLQEQDRQVQTALRRYRNQRANLQETPLMTVVAGYVELVQGQMLTVEQVTEAERAGVQAARAARLARIRRRPQNAGARAVLSEVRSGAEAVQAPQSAGANRPHRRDDTRIVAAPTPEESALRARPIHVVPPMPAIDVVGDVESVAVPVVVSVSAGIDVRDVVVVDVHPESVVVLEVPSDTEVMATTPGLPLADARPRRRREPVPANGIADPSEV